MQTFLRIVADAAWVGWWLGVAGAGLLTVLALQHALAGAPLVLSSLPPAGGESGAKLPTPAAAANAPPGTSAAAYVTAEASPPPLPAAAFIPGVPFTSQAPQGDWSLPFGEACEEASVLMAVAWAGGLGALSPARAEREILDLVAFENYAFGYNHDTSLAQTQKLFTGYYGYQNSALRYDMGLDDIKRELAAGHLLIVPVAGALLKNPYYASPPPYHMLLIRGYDDVAGEIIVNDPGTRHGAGFRYPSAVLFEAIHDWTGSDETILAGRKGMIVVRNQ